MKSNTILAIAAMLAFLSAALVAGAPASDDVSKMSPNQLTRQARN